VAHALLAPGDMRTKPIIALVCLAALSRVAFAAPEDASRSARALVLSRLIKGAVAQRTASATGPVASLIAKAKTEKDPLLQKFTVSTLVRQKMPLLRDQKVEILKMVRDETCGLLPKTPPIPKTGTVEIRHYSMSEFYEPDLTAFRNAGFTVTKSTMGAVATRGRLHVVISPTHENILEELNNPAVHMIVYNGHSQIGGVVEQALAQPGLISPEKRKLVALFQCIGTQVLPFLKTKAPNVDVIASNSPLYVNETPGLVQALYSGIEKNESYHRIARRVDESAWSKGRVLYPNQSVNLKHVDYDPNGELDVNQAVGKIEILPTKAARAAQSLMSGVHFLRSMNPYYVEESTKPVFFPDQVKIPVVAKGIARGDGKSVAHVVDKTVNGARQFEITLDSKFKGADPTFVGAASVYDLQMHLQKTFLGTPTIREKLRALAFAADYLDLIPRSSTTAEAAFEKLSTMQGLPRLSLWSVQGTLGGHVVNESAVDKLVALVNRSTGSTGTTPQ
jgi:hypothetical protein